MKQNSIKSQELATGAMQFLSNVELYWWEFQRNSNVGVNAFVRTTMDKQIPKYRSSDIRNALGPRSSGNNFMIGKPHLAQPIHLVRHTHIDMIQASTDVWLSFCRRRSNVTLYAAMYLLLLLDSGLFSIGPAWPSTFIHGWTRTEVSRDSWALLTFTANLLVFPHSHHCHEEHPTLKVVTSQRSTTHSRAIRIQKQKKSSGQKAFVKIRVYTKLSCVCIWCRFACVHVVSSPTRGGTLWTWSKKQRKRETGKYLKTNRDISFIVRFYP